VALLAWLLAGFPLVPTSVAVSLAQDELAADHGARPDGEPNLKPLEGLPYLRSVVAERGSSEKTPPGNQRPDEAKSILVDRDVLPNTGKPEGLIQRVARRVKSGFATARYRLSRRGGHHHPGPTTSRHADPRSLAHPIPGQPSGRRLIPASAIAPLPDQVVMLPFTLSSKYQPRWAQHELNADGRSRTVHSSNVRASSGNIRFADELAESNRRFAPTPRVADRRRWAPSINPARTASAPPRELENAARPIPPPSPVPGIRFADER
jgi:hypothetical protein